MVCIETFSLFIWSESFSLTKSAINWLILTWTWISVANALELRFELPFMDSLNHGTACSSHKFFMPKRISVEILWFFLWSLCQDYLQTLPQHMTFSDFWHKVKWKHKLTANIIITSPYGVCLHTVNLSAGTQVNLLFNSTPTAYKLTHSQGCNNWKTVWWRNFIPGTLVAVINLKIYLGQCSM